MQKHRAQLILLNDLRRSVDPWAIFSRRHASAFTPTVTPRMGGGLVIIAGNGAVEEALFFLAAHLR